MQKSAFHNKGVLFVIVASIFVFLSIFLVVKILNYKLEKISVETSFLYANKQEFNQKLKNKIGSSFWLLDLKSLKNELLEDVWLANVEISRSLSGVLRIKASEKKLFARWNLDYLLDEDLNILPDHPKAPVDIFKLETKDTNLVYAGSLAKGFLTMFKSYGIKLNKAFMSESGLWKLTIEDNILVELGKRSLDEKLNKLFFLWQAYLAQEADKITGFDLRYPNGLAIKKAVNEK